MLGVMRKHIKNNKGVTLVELLAVLIILGIIALIAVPAIAGVIDDSRYNAIKSSAINYIEAAELYVVTQDVEAGTNFSAADLTGYIDDRGGVTWNATGPSFSYDGTKVTITGTAKNKDVTVTFTNNSVEEINEMKRSKKQ